jgi:imidazole glycerol-phosphate synthase subunit HisF
MKVRIIAKLDVKPPNVVKPIHFEGLRVIDLPENLAKKYYLQGADEIFYIDIVASLYRREILYSYIKSSAEELFVPLAVGGGIQSIEDCSKLLHTGADKIIINTHAIQGNPEIINEAAEIFGNQSVVINIEAKKIGNSWECYSDCGRITSGKSVLDWVKECEERGGGEILLQSVDCDGRQKGFDIELAKSVVEAVDIPVVVASGAGSLKDMKDLVKYARPSGIAIASLLHYDKLNISEIKKYLRNNDIEVST